MSKFLQDFKGDIIKAIIGLIVVFLVSKWDGIVATFSTGANTEKQEEFEKSLSKAMENEDVVKKFLENDKFVDLFFESKLVREHTAQLGDGLRDQIIEDVMKKDTNKISMRSFIGMEIGVRDEDVLPLLSKLLDAYNKGEIMTKEEADDFIRREIRRIQF